MAVGCSHGHMIDRRSKDAVLKFIKDWKPEEVIHLGDFMDTAAFRGGAGPSSPDFSSPVRPDVEHGLDFLEQIGATLVFCGNHEDRLWHLSRSPSALISELAGNVIGEIERTCKTLKAELVPYHIKTGWRSRGNVLFGHGYMFNQLACRDHAEAVGSCVFAHTHTAGMAKGRRVDNPTGYCVGTLARINNMDYAKARRQTLAWSAGFVWGEFTVDDAVLWLHENGQRETWRLPV